ncbi:MAG: hypothetical protein LUC27_02300 [Lachnospiraceae bacterium]|nr:hypothetical protein [Lachnospiraceae bacterium]
MRHPYLRDAASLLGNAAALHTLYILLNTDLADRADSRGLLLWWGALLVSYALQAFFLHGLRLPKIALAVIPATLLAQILLTWRGGQAPGGLLGWLYLLLLWGVCLARSADFLMHPASAESRTLDFETSTLTFVLSVLLWSTEILPEATIWPPAIGSALTLLSLASQRTARAGRRGRTALSGRILLLLLPTVTVGVCLLFLRGLSSGASRGVQGLTAWLHSLLLRLSSLLSSLAVLIYRFFAWLFSLLPTAESTPTELPPPETAASAAAEATSETGSMFLIPLLILILVLGAVLIFTLFRQKLPLPSLPEASGRRMRLPHPWQRLRTQLRRLLRSLRFRLLCLTCRNTPSGLLVWLERALRMRKSGRTPDETSRRFLQRTGELLPDCRETLNRLADCLDRQYFGAEPSPIPADEIRRMRRQLQDALRDRS